ncbi:NAD(P)H oxidoreductase [Paenibacillus albicereus]|uniref:NAD(P)H oxidoreductase n=1 Tax=Paenibacillus albicereus TaxID=2726185 RepID=A0A6H2GSN4_9BACL|nr:NAD(P)H oxidoreductase [Paenibacillus albicereus]QJC50405.1 NAD(P)H oxidoreductase [Paenibacillus albicereus]
MNVLIVAAHPRSDSLTLAVTERFRQGLLDAGHGAEVLDLYRSGFDPSLRQEDEPDWSNERKVYSAEAEAEMERMKRHDALAYIFPIWWYGMPAMLKGYIDRVWNYGFAYGSSKLSHRRVLWLGLAAATQEQLGKRSYDKMMAHLFNVGLSEYAGIAESRFEILYDTLRPDPAYAEQLLAGAYELGLHYSDEWQAAQRSDFKVGAES